MCVAFPDGWRQQRNGQLPWGWLALSLLVWLPVAVGSIPPLRLPARRVHITVGWCLVVLPNPPKNNARPNHKQLYDS